MSTNKIKKTVSFNITNEDDQSMLEHIKQINFSGYVKDLIRDDMARRSKPISIVKKTEGGGLKIVIGG